MRIGLVSSTLPLARGGGRFIVDWLAQKLIERGHEAEAIYLPFNDDPRYVLSQMAAFRLLRLDDSFERIVAFRPPAHLIEHRNKVVWFIHHVRIFYDMWDTPYNSVPRDMSGEALRETIIKIDTRALGQAKRVFTNSKVVGERIRQFNGLTSEVLYPPVFAPEIFHAGAYGDEIVCICRMEHHKRQHLLVAAMALTTTPVRLRLCGGSMHHDYINSLKADVARLKLGQRVTIETRWISEEEKAGLFATALASAYLPLDEDSYGYPTIEAAHAARSTLTTADSGGVLEFVADGATGLVAAPEPKAIAAAMDRLYADRGLAGRLGRQAQARLGTMGIDWDTVIGKLVA